jgi:hypothetical protein
VEAHTQAIGFSPGTPIHTRLGLKPVETIAVGDWVLARPGDAAPPTRRRTAPEYTYRRVVRIAATTQPSRVQITYTNAPDKIRETIEGTGKWRLSSVTGKFYTAGTCALPTRSGRRASPTHR